MIGKAWLGKVRQRVLVCLGNEQDRVVEIVGKEGIKNRILTSQ